MIHNQVSEDPNGGHWGANVSSDGIHLLVQIGEVNEARQARLRLTVPAAIHLAADLLAAVEYEGKPGSVQIGEDDEAWELWRTRDVFSLTLRDDDRNADPEAWLEMPTAALDAMAREILRLANTLLAARGTEN